MSKYLIANAGINQTEINVNYVQIMRSQRENGGLLKLKDYCPLYKGFHVTHWLKIFVQLYF